MLDIELIRNDPAAVLARLNRRGKDFSSEIGAIVRLDERRRLLLERTNRLNAERNRLSEQVAGSADKGSADVKKLHERVKGIKEELAGIDVESDKVAHDLETLLYSVPNMPHAMVVDGKNEADNIVVAQWGKPLAKPKVFLDHWTYAEKHSLADFENAVRIAGTRQVFYRGNGARLARALESFMLDTHGAAGYSELLGPDLVSKTALVGTGQLPKFGEDLFRLEGTDLYLSPTAEVQLTNFYANKILTEQQLPIKLCGFTHCFRAEAGSAGRDVKGVIRLHQFRKVEMVRIVTAHDSYEHLEQITADAEKILQLLELPYRKVLLCTGDMGFGSSMTYDLEVWMPSYDKYKEVSSATNFESFQARRAKIRVKKADGAKEPPHTLNASGLPIDRVWAAIVENFQDENGKVTVPTVLRPYLGGLIHL